MVTGGAKNDIAVNVVTPAAVRSPIFDQMPQVPAEAIEPILQIGRFVR